jgi:transposase
MARRSYSHEFKLSAAQLITQQGYSAAQAARSLGVDAASIRDWVRRLGPSPNGTTPTTSTGLQAELQRLRDENRRLRMEREILKKATAFFAKEQP